MSISGVPWAGKSTLIKSLGEVFSVHRLLMLQGENLDQQMAYAEGKRLLALDDMSDTDWATLFARRALLDGLSIVGNKKFEEQRSFRLPGVVITSNLQQAELMSQKDRVALFVPSKDDKYYHLKTTGYHWKAVAVQPPVPPEISKLHLQIALARIVHDTIRDGIDCTVFEDALLTEGIVYPKRDAEGMKKYYARTQRSLKEVCRQAGAAFNNLLFSCCVYHSNWNVK